MIRTSCPGLKAKLSCIHLVACRGTVNTGEHQRFSSSFTAWGWCHTALVPSFFLGSHSWDFLRNLLVGAHIPSRHRAGSPLLSPYGPPVTQVLQREILYLTLSLTQTMA